MAGASLGGRLYANPGAPSTPSSGGGLDYLPAGGAMSPFGMAPDPVTRGPGKSILTQHLGSVVGKRGAGLSMVGGGDQGSHSLGHYGKGGLRGLVKDIGGQI